jgi:lipase chaperone LimK
MVKKLQENSVWAKYDIDQDGTVSDEELERATQMLELDLREEKQDSQRRIAWVAMSSMVLYSLLPLLAMALRKQLN